LGILGRVSEKERLGRQNLQGVLETRLALERARAGITQAELARVAGIPLTTYRRLERGQMDNPPIQYLTNLALSLDVNLLDVCEDKWLEWTQFPGSEIDEVPLKEVFHDPERWFGNLPPELWRKRTEPRRFKSFVPDRAPFKPFKPLKRRD
jgi:transcriptional regulator with XRE-family HTH domain